MNFRKQICSICVSKMASHWSFLRIHRFQSHHVAPPCTKSQANLQLSMAALASSKKNVFWTTEAHRGKNIKKTWKHHGSTYGSHTWKDLVKDHKIQSCKKTAEKRGSIQLCALAARHHRTGIEGRVDGWKWNSVAKNLLRVQKTSRHFFSLILFVESSGVEHILQAYYASCSDLACKT